MDDIARRNGDDELPLPQIKQANPPTIADQVYDVLHERILSLSLPPLTRISEAEVAGKMGVSRQPVREAFKRLAKYGFLTIRPQSRTTVSLISEKAILRARYTRIALETHTCRTACQVLTEAGYTKLKALLDAQQAAIEAQDRARFHMLDDQFHKEICIQSGVSYVWDIIHESKGHMDRVRMLSLNTPSQKLALDQHIELYDALVARDPELARIIIDKHLTRILGTIEEIKAEKHSWFTDAPE